MAGLANSVKAWRFNSRTLIASVQDKEDKSNSKMCSHWSFNIVHPSSTSTPGLRNDRIGQIDFIKIRCSGEWPDEADQALCVSNLPNVKQSATAAAEDRAFFCSGTNPNIYFSNRSLQHSSTAITQISPDKPISLWHEVWCICSRSELLILPPLTVSFCPEVLFDSGEIGVNLCFIVTWTLPSGGNRRIWKTCEEVVLCSATYLFYPRLCVCVCVVRAHAILQHMIDFLFSSLILSCVM